MTTTEVPGFNFIANDGSYAHRGVWHITNNMKAIDHLPETKDQQFGGPNSVIYRYVDEGYTEYIGDAICGQVKNLREGRLNWSSSFRIPVVDGVKTIKRRALRANVVIGIDGYIPGPLCSRCARKVGLEGF